MAKVKFSLEQTLNDDYSAVTEKHPRYKLTKKRFKKNLLAMDYEADLEKEKKRKKLKEEVEEISDDELIRIVKRKIPEATNLKKEKGNIIFEYKGNKFFIFQEVFLDTEEFTKELIISPIDTKLNINHEVWKISQKLDSMVNSIDIKDAERITKEIKNASTKLPKKSLKLEDALNEKPEKGSIEWIKKAKAIEIAKNFSSLMVKNTYKNGLDRIINLIKKNTVAVNVDALYYIVQDWKLDDDDKNKVISISDLVLKKYPGSIAGSLLLFAVRKWGKEYHNKIKKVLDKTPWKTSKEYRTTFPLDVKEAIKLTKEIRDTAIKLPKKTLKLEDVLTEQDLSKNDMIKLIRKKIPEAKEITNVPSTNYISFRFKNYVFFLAEKDGQISVTPRNLPSHPSYRTELMETLQEVQNLIKTPTRKEAIEITKNIRKTSIKLPRKSLKLKEAVEKENLTIFHGFPVNPNQKLKNYKERFQKFVNIGPLNAKQIEELANLFKEIDDFDYALFNRARELENHKKYEIATEVWEVKEGSYDLLKAIAEFIEDLDTWKDFDAFETKEILDRVLGQGHEFGKTWEYGYKSAKTINKRIKEKSTKLPKKTLKLEDTLDEAEIMKFENEEQFDKWLKGASAETIFSKGEKNIPGFNYDKAFEKLFKFKKSLYFQFAIRAFKKWENLDKEKHREKFLQALYSGEVHEFLIANMEVYKTKGIDINKLQDVLLKNIAKNFQPIRTAEETLYIPVHNWPGFNYEKTIKFLKSLIKTPDDKRRVNKIISEFPFGIDAAKSITKNIRKTSEKLPKKSLKLESAVTINEAVSNKDVVNLLKILEGWAKNANQKHLFYSFMVSIKKDNPELFKKLKKDVYEIADKYNLENYVLNFISPENYAKKKIEDIKKSSDKLPKKSLKLEDTFDKDKAIVDFLKRAKEEFLITLKNAIKSNFNKESLIKMMKNLKIITNWFNKVYYQEEYPNSFGQEVYGEVQDILDEVITQVCELVFYKTFNFMKALDVMKEVGVGKGWIDSINNDWMENGGVGAKEAKYITKKIKDTAIKLPKKKLKLESVICEEKDLSKMNVERIYSAGIHWKRFDYKKGLDELIKNSKSGSWIYYAGKNWKEFDFKKGLEGLIKKDKSGSWIYNAGVIWKSFDYEKGLEALKNTKYYNSVSKYWPKGIKEIKYITKEIRDTATKLPNKKLKLEAVLEPEDAHNLYTVYYDRIIPAFDRMKEIGFNHNLFLDICEFYGEVYDHSEDVSREVSALEADLDIWLNKIETDDHIKKELDELQDKLQETEEKLSEILGKTFELTMKVEKFKNFSREKALNIARKSNVDLYYGLEKIYKMGVKDSEEAIEKLRKNSTKLPKKSLKLEDTLNEDSKEAREATDLINQMKSEGYSNEKFKKLIDVYSVLAIKSSDAYRKILRIRKNDSTNNSKNLNDIRDEFHRVEAISNDIISEMEDFYKLKNFNRSEALRIAGETLSNAYLDMLKDIWPLGAKEAKQEIDYLKKTSTKLPKKTLKLEDSLDEEYELEDLKRIIKLKFPEVKDIKKDSVNTLTFEYKDREFYAELDIDTNNFYADVYFDGSKLSDDEYKKVMNISAELEHTINAKDIKFAKSETEKIRKNSTKLPKKKLKLENTLQH